MNKVMVQLEIPVSGKSYDILIPKTLSVAQTSRMLSGFFQGILGGAYLPDKQAVLCNAEDGTIYDINSSIDELHLKNGSKLILI